MALSPFRAHKQRVIAAQEWADSPQMPSPIIEWLCFYPSPH